MGSGDWHTEDFPELRSGPPWVMQEMIAAGPAVVEALLADPPPGVSDAAAAIVATLKHRLPVIVCGCGTSEHAAHAVAALISAPLAPEQAALVVGRASLDAALDPLPGLCLGISHEGATRATLLALGAARERGAATIAITNNPAGDIASVADTVIATPTHDQSWCHTIAYISALAVGAGLAGRLGSLAFTPAAGGDLLERAAEGAKAAELAGRLAHRRVVLCAGAQVDQVTARELALKIAEGARLPAIPLELETVLHGHLAAYEPADVLVLVAITDHPDRTRIAHRAEQLARAVGAIGLPVVGLLSDVYDRTLPAELTPAGRLVIELPDPGLIDSRLAGLLAGAGALQSLTLELAHVRGTNPDLIRREEEPYRAAAAQAEASSSW